MNWLKRRHEFQSFSGTRGVNTVHHVLCYHSLAFTSRVALTENMCRRAHGVYRSGSFVEASTVCRKEEVETDRAGPNTSHGESGRSAGVQGVHCCGGVAAPGEREAHAAVGGGSGSDCLVIVPAWDVQFHRI